MTRAGIDRADIVFLFFTADHIAESERLLAAACRVTGTDRIVGCSGAGVLTGEGEVEGGPGLAVLVVSSDCVRGHPFLFHPLRDRDRELGIDLARGAGKRLEENSLLVLFPDAYNGQPQIVFQGIEDQFGFLPAVGAGSSENGTQGKTYQLCGQAMTSNAVSGVCLTGPFHSSIGITQGCRPVTEPMIITKAQGNLIFEIDNRPAFEFFARAIKGPLLEDLRRALTCVFAGLPSDPDNNRVAPGEYLVRNIVGLDPEKGILAVAEKVFQGERIVLTLRDAQRAREDLNQMLQRQSISLGDRAPQFGLYFNCCARGTSLYGISGIDTAYIRQALGDFPLVGFFGNFELGPLGGKNRLLAYTGVLVLVTER
ncbi:MAG: FIST C-terminal domain-containing protein [Deltaproteobacteria bacterium]|nr:FIST C-terminal domain-containing protein [Deltaproteobacteria bacterium]